jgi:hypothetical protein
VHPGARGKGRGGPGKVLSRVLRVPYASGPATDSAAAAAAPEAT